MNTLFNRVTIERDTNNKKLEENLFSKLAEIVQPHQPGTVKKDSIRFVGVEDALKELLELEKISQGN